MRHKVWLGSYTDASLAGIQLLEVDGASGAVELRYTLQGIENPTYLVLNSSGTRLYTVCRSERAGTESFGAIAAYRVEGERLQLINRCHTPGSVPCHLSLAPDGRALAFAEYRDANCGVVQLDESGGIAVETLVTTQQHGSGADAVRQASAHAHFAAVTPDLRWLYVCDLGCDALFCYSYEQALAGELRLAHEQTLRVAPGAGPRHLRFHPNGRFAWLLNELDSSVLALAYDGDSFEVLQRISALPAGFSGESKAAALKFTADGNWLLTSNRGHDSIAAFKVDAASGLLELCAISPLSGPFPRDFELLQGSELLLAGHKHINEVGVYRFDRNNGHLQRLPWSHSCHRPTCIVDATVAM